jgi:uncharacterized protein YlxW (UPF0749 family)
MTMSHTDRPGDEETRPLRVPSGEDATREIRVPVADEEATQEIRTDEPARKTGARKPQAGRAGTGEAGTGEAGTGEAGTGKAGTGKGPAGRVRAGRAPADQPAAAAPAPEPHVTAPERAADSAAADPSGAGEQAPAGDLASEAAGDTPRDSEILVTATSNVMSDLPRSGEEPAESVEEPSGEVEEPGGEYEEPGGEYEEPGGIPVGRRQRFSAAGAVIGLLLGLLGFALVVQLRSNATDPELAASRPEDLVRILSDLEARQDRLRGEIAALEDSQRQLASGAQGREAALEEARRRADQLGILAGTLPAQGSGLQISFVPGKDGIPAATVLDAVEELRGAGAEAMQIVGAGGPAVRIVASTYFADARDGLVVDGAHLAAPYTLVVIGGPQTMHTALNIPGGVVDTVRQRGGNVIVQESDAVRVTALHQVAIPRFARPVS